MTINFNDGKLMWRSLKSQSLSTQEVHVHTHQHEFWVQTTYNFIIKNVYCQRLYIALTEKNIILLIIKLRVGYYELEWQFKDCLVVFHQEVNFQMC